MGFLKQALVAAVVLVLAGALWLRFDRASGDYLASSSSPLPESLRPLVAAIAPAGGPRTIAPTTPRTGERPAPLVVVDAARADVTRQRLQALGTGEAERAVAVYPDAAGIVTEIAFEPGERVSAGQVLARLENDNERLALDRARIALRAAEQQVERYRALSSSAAITAVQIEEVERALQTAQLDLRAAEIALERRDILAPIDGRVGLSPVNRGTLVGNQTLVATIDDRERLKVVFLAPEGFVSDLDVGMPVTARPTTRSGRSYEGEIAALDSRIDEASRTLRVEALIDNGNDDLRPGMSFSIEMDLPGEAFLSVDPLSVQWERAGPFVWVVEGDAARKASVRIIERNVDRVLLASDDLDEGDAVVVEGIQSLREGVAVRRLDRQAPLPEPVDAGDPVASTNGREAGVPDRRAAVGPGEAAAAEVGP